MKIIVIALMVFFLNLSISMVDILDLYNDVPATDNQLQKSIDKTLDTAEFNPDIAADVSTSFGFGDFTSGFLRFRDMMFRVVNVSATLHNMFGLDEGVAKLFGGAIGILYIIGIAQFIANRSTKGMQ